MVQTAFPTVLDRLVEHASARPDAPSFGVDDEVLSWADLLIRIRRLAAGLAAEGLGPGERCAVLLPTSLDRVVAILAAQWTGAAPVVIDSKLPAEVIDKRLRLLRPRVTLVRDETARQLRYGDEAPGAVLNEPSAFCPTDAEAERAPHRATPDAPAYLQLTSGTTGEPKAAVVSHRALRAFLPAFADPLGMNEHDICVTWVPMYHDYGLIKFLFIPVHVGCECHHIPAAVSNFPRWLRTIHDLRATVTGSPDFGYRIATRMVKPSEVDLSCLRAATSGGEPVRAETIRRFVDHFGMKYPICGGYGQAETTLAMSVGDFREPLRVDEAGNVANGRPLRGFELRIADEAGKELDAGQVGQIHVKGPYLFDGYFEDAEATAEAYCGPWLDTGDNGYLDEEGYLYILGRRRAMIKRAGALIAPREIEEAAERVEGIRRTAAIGAPEGEEGLTEMVVLLAEIQPDAYPTTAERAALAETISESIAGATGHMPGDVVLLVPGSIELTHNGKIRYPSLRQRYLDRELEKSGVVLFPEPAGKPGAKAHR